MLMDEAKRWPSNVAITQAATEPLTRRPTKWHARQVRVSGTRRIMWASSATHRADVRRVIIPRIGGQRLVGKDIGYPNVLVRPSSCAHQNQDKIG
jgi:hypothetical protein